MQLITDLFSPEITHVINDQDEPAGTVQGKAGQFVAHRFGSPELPDGGRRNFTEFQAAVNYLISGKLPKQEKPRNTSHLDLFS